MAQPAATRLLLSLSDVARLARVQRPVVSMWRARAAASSDPFPAAIATRAGQQLFDAGEIAAWLEATGRGNNPSAAEDLAAFATADEISPRTDRVAFDAVTAVLCLQVITGRRVGGLDRDELLDLADERDPDDRLLYTELEAAGDRVDAIARFTDELADAAMSAPAAFENLMADRFRSELPEHRSSMLSDAALAVVARTAVGLAHRGTAFTYVDPTPGSADVVLAVVREHGDSGPFELMTTPSNAPATRLARRRLRVHDVYREDLAVGEGGAFAGPDAATYVAQYPSPGEPAMSDLQILTAIENVVVQMDDSQSGVVIAPATALCDGHADRAASAVRADILRAGHVRAIVRLPRGLVLSRSRQALALWVLGPSHHEDEPAERRTMVADLSAVRLTDDVIDNLVTDVTAATGGRDLVRAHAFAHLRPVPTRALLVARRSLVEIVPPGRQPNADDTAGLALRIAELREQVGRPIPIDVPVPAVSPAPGSSPAHRMTIGSALTARNLRVLSGNRIDAADLGAGQGVRVLGVRVLGVPELVGDAEVGARTIDRLLLASRYDAARLTEPGDVVFCTSPRPAAIVDRDGGTVVAFPARVLRIDPADPGGLVPDVLAADINTAAPADRQWRRWPVRSVADDQRAVLSDALSTLRQGREQIRLRLDRLDELADALTRAATSGALTLHPVDRTAKGR